MRKPRLNFVSTMSCIPTVEWSSTQQIIEHVTSEMGGYEQSKWVAEQLVLQALERNRVSGGIMRLGMVGWHSISGVGNPNDWLYYLFAGITQLGKYPDSGSQFEILPVNVVSKILVQLGNDSLPSPAIDICGTTLVPFRNLAAHLKNVEKVPFQIWVEYLFEQIKNSTSQNRKSLEGLLLFSGGLPDSRKFQKDLENRCAFVASRFAEVSKLYSESEIEKYFEFIAAWGIVIPKHQLYLN